MISGVETALASMTSAASTLGAAKNRISIQKDFVGDLMNVIDKGISTLVDADMTAESTRLQALQTQQQLGIQALSIANSGRAVCAVAVPLIQTTSSNPPSLGRPIGRPFFCSTFAQGWSGTLHETT